MLRIAVATWHVLLTIGAFAVVASCSSGDSRPDATPTWHCYSQQSGGDTYCTCALATDAQLASGGGEKPPWSTKPCPPSNYSCCERDRSDRCTCHIANDHSSCGNGAVIVSSCPPL